MKPQTLDHVPSTLSLAMELGLESPEYEYICRRLERVPNYAEVGVFSAMYSEHCSYKSSKKYLRRLPTSGKRVLQGPGENAGILDIGSGHAIVFKMESHNHPSFIEPYQGAATGVGGILRDIFTMGARPIANMNGLCFGDPQKEKGRALVSGVVKGIGDYGNCVGVPTVAGQTFFHPSYNGNPLVNAFTLGFLPKEKIHRGIAKGPGNLVVYVGSKTGRDGVHGATMASQEFSTDEELDRPTVQVGDPFTEKLLLEASLEVMEKGLVVGIQDMGAAGLTSSSFEMAGRAKTGMELDLDRVPVRESGMSAYEILLSESQERMLLVCEPGKWDALKAVFEKWDLHSEVIGKVVEGNRVRMKKDGALVVDLPVELVTDPPEANRAVQAVDTKKLWEWDRKQIDALLLEQKITLIVDDISFAQPTPLARQYDSTVGNRTESGIFEDAAVIRLRDIKENLSLALSTDCSPRVSFLSPREGGRRAVAEAAVNVAILGAEPIGITDCLNFGSPKNPEVMWRFQESVEGISEACRALEIPVISGNVSFYNDTDGTPVYPAPMIGLVGVIEGSRKTHHLTAGLIVGILGDLGGDLQGSLLSSLVFQKDSGKPKDTDLVNLKKTVEFLQQLSRSDIFYVAHDISEGGLLTSLLEMSFHSTQGPGFSLKLEGDTDSILFGEGCGRVVIAFEPKDEKELSLLIKGFDLPFTLVGKTVDEKTLAVGSLLSHLAPIREKWEKKWGGFF